MGSKKKTSQSTGRLGSRAAQPSIQKRGVKQTTSLFDSRFTRKKKDVVNAKEHETGGGVRKVSQSRGAAEHRRKAQLLAELHAESRANVIADRRIGENEEGLTEADRYLARYQREASRRVNKKSIYNLEDEDNNNLQDDPDHDDDGDGARGILDSHPREGEFIKLTHKGKQIDDYDILEDIQVRRKKKQSRGEFSESESDSEASFDLDDEQRDHIASKYHFGNMQDEYEDGEEEDDDDDDNTNNRSRTHAEVMAEVVMKSKMYKMERQREKAHMEDTREKLDQQLRDIIDILPKRYDGPKSNPTADMLKLPLSKDLKAKAISQEDKDALYDLLVHELAEEKKAHASQRLPTEQELADMELQKLKQLERKRLLRMQGIEEDGDEDEDDGVRARNAKKRKAASGDDANDGFILPGDKLENESDGDEDGNHDEYSQGNGENSDLDDSEAEFVSSSEDEEEENEEESDEDDMAESRPKHSKAKLKFSDGHLLHERYYESENVSTTTGEEENDDTVPFVYQTCPQSYDELMTLFHKRSPRQRALIVSRLRTCFSARLDPSGKNVASRRLLLHALLTRLVRCLELNDLSTTDFQDKKSYQQLKWFVHEMDLLVPEIFGLAISDKAETLVRWARSAIKQLGIRFGILHEDQDGHSETNKAYTSNLGLGDLVLMKALGRLFPTSDLRHPITTPCMITLSAFLSCGTFDSFHRLALGVMAAALLQSWFAETGRFCGELLRFILSIIASACSPKFLQANSAALFPNIQTTISKQVYCYQLPKIDEAVDLLQLELRDIYAEDDKVPIVKGRVFLSALHILESMISSCAIVPFEQSGNARDIGRSMPSLPPLSIPSYAETLEPVELALKNILDTLHSKSGTIADQIRKLVEMISQLRARVLETRKPLHLYEKRVAMPKLLNPKLETPERKERLLLLQRQRDHRGIGPGGNLGEITKLKKRVRREERAAMREIKKDSAVRHREVEVRRKKEDAKADEKRKQVLTFLQDQQHTWNEQVKKQNRLKGKW